jgi:hypothetical protein
MRRRPRGIMGSWAKMEGPVYVQQAPNNHRMARGASSLDPCHVHSSREGSDSENMQGKLKSPRIASHEQAHDDLIDSTDPKQGFVTTQRYTTRYRINNP